MAFPESFQNQTQQNELQKEHCVKENRGMDKDNPKLPQTGKITIIYIAPLQLFCNVSDAEAESSHFVFSKANSFYNISEREYIFNFIYTFFSDF